MDGVPLFTPSNDGDVTFSIKLRHFNGTSGNFRVYVLDAPYNNTSKFSNPVNITVGGSATSNLVTPNVLTEIKIPKIESGKDYYLLWTIDGKTCGGELVELGTAHFEYRS